jgi:uncharacterized protein
MAESSQPLAIVTGASTGIGFELAKIAAKKGYALVIAADEPEIQTAASRIGGKIEAVQADLATTESVDQLLQKVGSRPIQVLCANAGRGLGRAFVEQDWADIRRVIDTNVTGTTYLLHKVTRLMKQQAKGRILITGSIAGFMPGSYQAVYNGTKAFLDSFSYALREELKDTDVSVTCLMPGPTETEFFERADMTDTKIGTEDKMDPAEVAKQGYDAMMSGEGQVITGWKNKMQAAMSHIMPAEQLATQHTKEAAPGTAKH